MKTALILIVGVIGGYLLAGNATSSSEVTYSDHGIKTVVATCSKDKSCIISIGQECDSSGYKIVTTDHDDQKTIMTAECGKEKTPSLMYFGK